MWFAPSLPVGSFAYSQGLEFAVEAGLVRDEEALREWLSDLLERGGAANDLVFAAQSWKAATTEDWPALIETAELAAAIQPSAERYLEVVTQGACFLEAVKGAWRTQGLEPALAHLAGLAIAYPIATGIAAACHKIRPGPFLAAYALAFVSNQASAAIRLGLIGQTAGQRIIAGLLDAIEAAAEKAMAASLDSIGTACFSADLASIEHETQYSRLFRT
ncbi:MAG: urease accessory protein UreF [Rhodomicrobium sp.]|nr:urease accessory protein UreF [Rhodomicrobium sp.]